MRTPALPRVPLALLRTLLPLAERSEVLADIQAEFVERTRTEGEPAARRWLWRQVGGSFPSLLRRSWWRGWTGFEPQANRMRPGGFIMEGWIIDARYAVRRLARRPTWAALAILTLALGVGGTAAAFAIARGLLLDPLPVAREGELASFWMPYDWTEEEFSFLRGQVPGFAQVAAYRPRDLTLQAEGSPTRLLQGMATTAEFFGVLGVNPLLGRGFAAGDDAPGAEPVAVLSHSLWRELGGDPSIVGRTVRFDGVSRTVVGVMPEGFWFPYPTVRVWTPAPINPERRVGLYALVGRLSPGQRLGDMAPALERLRAMLDQRFDYPAQWNKLAEPSLTPVRDYLVGDLRPALLATLAAISLTLLMACANVAALMLGQVEMRTTELAVRTALGAERSRLVRQLVVESIVIGVAAGVAGAGVAGLAFRTLAGALPLGAWGETASLGWGVFGIAMAVALAASLLVAVVPVFSLWHGQLHDAIARTRTGGVGAGGGRLESGLVVVEVALAVLMTAGAALLTRSVVNLQAIDPGVTTQGVAVLDLAMGADLTATQRQQVMREATEALGSLPGVAMAGATSKLPLRGSGDNWGLSVEGRPDLEQSTTAFRIVSRDYLATLGISALRGRTFDISDRAGGETVVVINEALAAKYFPDVEPVGRRIGTGYDTTWARIVGVVSNGAEAGLTDAATPARYMLAEQVPFVPPGQALVVRLADGGGAERILDVARETMRRVAPAVAVQNATTMERVLEQAMGTVRQVVTLLLLLTGLALVLGAVGVYGVISHFAERRRRDWGIQLALGLRPSRVVRRVVGRGAGLVLVGIAAGTGLALMLARLLGSMLYGVGAGDPVAYAAAGATLLLTGVIAAWVPAQRASRLDPARVLRED